MAKKVTTEELVNEIIGRGIITEREISLLKSRRNSGDEVDLSACEWDLPVGNAQAQKGYSWLKNLAYTPMGRDRKNSPFGYREMVVIDSNIGDISFSFNGFYQGGYYKSPYYVTIYTCRNKSGDFFQYINDGGIKIIG